MLTFFVLLIYQSQSQLLNLLPTLVVDHSMHELILNCAINIGAAVLLLHLVLKEK